MTHHGFAPDEQKAIAALVAQIIPASETFNQPGADDPNVLNDILSSGAGLQLELAVALASLSNCASMTASRAEEFRRAFPVEAELIQTLVAQCYYRDARVMRALNIDVRPPFPAGYQQEPNDLTLLEPVRQRGEMYRKIHCTTEPPNTRKAPTR